MGQDSRQLDEALTRAARLRDERLSTADRRRRGVVHTPPEVARFVARRVRARLAEFEDTRVTFVDPACGPGVFLAACMDEIPGPHRAIGYDVDGRALEDAEALLRPFADARGWSLTLEERETLSSPLDVGGPVVVIGNPPWAGRSANLEAGYTEALLDDFRREPDGSKLRELKVGVLSDDYVRFFRWACEGARRPGGGIVAFVTNASFLDGPVHRGMRAALMRWFSSVEIIDLGGSALIARAGDRDDNVFGVRPGVAITVAERPADHREIDEGARVAYASSRGSRAEKLEALGAGLEARELSPRAPLLRFVPTVYSEVYESWPSLAELMPFHREGIQTNRDAFCVDDDRARLRERVEAFARGEAREWPGRAGEARRHYDPDAARAALRAELEAGVELIQRLAYRPFDDRHFVATRRICHRSRPALREAMERSELALLTVRKDRGERAWMHFAVSRHVPESCYLSSRSSCRTRAFPTHRPDGSSNVDAEAVRAWCGRALEPIDLVRYALCVFASEAYRERFGDALRADYPRLPPPPDEATLRACVEAGRSIERAFLEPVEERSREIDIGHRRVCAPASLAPALLEHAATAELGQSTMSTSKTP